MATSILSSSIILAETLKPASANNSTQYFSYESCSPWIVSTSGLGFLLLILGIWTKVKLSQKQKAIAEAQQLNYQLQEELSAIRKNLEDSDHSPDLTAARSILLDYIRMRMDEEVFHYVIMNQIRAGITDSIGVALRRTVEIPQGSRDSNLQIDQIFDIAYDIEITEGQWTSGVLFRMELKLSQLPTQSSSNTVNQMLQCIELFLSHSMQQPRWHSDLQGILITLAWDENTKPIPLLCLGQSEEKKAKERSRSFIGTAL